MIGGNERSQKYSLAFEAGRYVLPCLLWLITLCLQAQAETVAVEAAPLKIHGLAFEFIRIPAGQFVMGSETGDNDERPVHSVAIARAYDMGRTEVTVAQFRAFADATGYKTQGERANWSAVFGVGVARMPDHKINWRRPGFAQCDDDPVVCISYNDATAFCEWLSKESGAVIRLPSEAEWEYACRTGGQGKPAGDIGQMGWYYDNAELRTHPVAQKKPNAWGLYDMQGNVWEWCRDMWHWSYRDAPVDASPETVPETDVSIAARRVMRGGSWCRRHFELSPTYRYRAVPGFRATETGFRLVRDVEPYQVAQQRSAAAQSAARVGEPDTVSYRSSGDLMSVQVKDVEFHLIRITPGEFSMGSVSEDWESPVRQVRIPGDFYMGKTEVTVEQFRTFTDETGYMTDAEKERWAWTRVGPSDWNPKHTLCWWNLGFEQSDQDPASCISWHDALAFCGWLSEETHLAIELPSAAEWEYACRAGEKGDCYGPLNEIAWYRGNSGIRTHPVAQKKPNAWGLYDVHGNVWEWCKDMWHPGYDGAPMDGSAWVTSDIFIPVMRGGSFTNPPWWLRSANNMLNDPGFRYSYNQGLRIVCRPAASSRYARW